MPSFWEVWKLGFGLAQGQGEALSTPQPLPLLLGEAPGSLAGSWLPAPTQNGNCCVLTLHVSRWVVPVMCYCHCLENNILGGQQCPGIPQVWLLWLALLGDRRV